MLKSYEEYWALWYSEYWMHRTVYGLNDLMMRVCTGFPLCYDIYNITHKYHTKYILGLQRMKPSDFSDLMMVL